jgi:hypothetical protein
MNLLNLNNIDHVHSATWTLYPKDESNTDALIMLKVNLKIFKKATFHVLVKNVSSHDQNRFQHLSREIWPGLAPAQKYVSGARAATKNRPCVYPGSLSNELGEDIQ